MLDIDRLKKARIKEAETFEDAVTALQAALEARRDICILIGEPSKLNHDALILASRSQRARCKEIIDGALHVGLLAARVLGATRTGYRGLRMGMLFKVPAFEIWAVVGLWAFALCFEIMQKVLGTGLAVLALFLGPILFYVAPWYAGFAWGDRFPLMLGYGGTIGGGVLYAIGAKIDGD